MKASDEYGFQPAGRAAEAGGTGSKGERMMILADKLIELRKKNGWSQEELAEQLDVSRQSISKWESAQSTPDMNRILKMSDIFGVSTDYLLKDAMVMLPEERCGNKKRMIHIDNEEATQKWAAFCLCFTDIFVCLIRLRTVCGKSCSVKCSGIVFSCDS